MKKILYYSLLAVLCSCSQPKQFTLNGTIHGIDNDQLVIGTYSHETMGLQGIDTIPVRNGRFKYSLPAIETSTYVFQLKTANLSFSCILENGNLNLIADASDAQQGSIRQIELTGSENHDLLQQYHKMHSTVMNRAEFSDCKVAYEKMMAAYEQKNYEVYDQLKKEYHQISGDLNKEVWKAQKELMTQNIDKYFITQVFPFIKREATPDEMLALYRALPKSLKQNPNIIRVKKDMDAKLSIQPGKVAPDFTLKTTEGKDLSLSDLKGKIVLIDFWASWCKPCRESFPHMIKLYEKYHPKGFEVLGVTNDSNHKAWKKAIKDDGIPWLNVADEFPENGPVRTAKVITSYGMDYLPSTVLIDKKGIIIAKLLHGDELDKKLEEIFGF